MTVQTKEISGLTFNDVSAENYRVYTFRDGDAVRVNNPLWLNVSNSGGHRIVVADNSTVYIPAGWVKLQWWNKEGFEPLQF